MSNTKTGVIVVDVQGDFTEVEQGSLAVKGTDQRFIDGIRMATQMLKQRGFPIFATQDWHPPTHISFCTNHPGKKPFDVFTINGKERVLWPPHCVQGTSGASLLLDDELFNEVVRKGDDARYDSYSGFKDEGGKSTRLHDLLQDRGINRLIVFGIATDYCVRATVLDAVALRYKVMMIEDLTRGVDPETTRSALEEMQERRVLVLDKFDLQEIQRLTV